MDADFGAVSLRRRRVWFFAALALAAALLAAILTANARYHQAGEAAKARAWASTVGGPPCRALSPADYHAQPYRPSKTFAYDDIRFSRFAGNAECDEVRDRGGRGAVMQECRFSSPALLIVASRAGAFAFAPDPGRSALVIVRDGRPSCIVGDSFVVR